MADETGRDQVKSVLQDWVTGLSLRKQGVLLLALRGPDGVRKESPTKPVVRTLRGLVMVSGREGVPMAPGQHFRDDSFMNMRDVHDPEAWVRLTRDFFSDVDSYNVHFYQHLIHAFAVCGHDYPHDEEVRLRCLSLYHGACRRLHVRAESRAELSHRLRDGVRPEHDE